MSDIFPMAFILYSHFICIPPDNNLPNKFKILVTLSLLGTGMRNEVCPVSLSSSTIESTSL